ncbi:MAG TPA: B12-binding domain-containing protein [Pyrinomonadaceae bacterium]|jgi:excisionase family DNA binding protein|nr:B12-binding domain-containing protein [Pyrinomonadaceae bacterium]
MKFLTTRQLARMWQVSEATIKRWADAGHLLSSRTLGGHRRFALDEVARFQTSRGLSGSTPARREDHRAAQGTAQQSAPGGDDAKEHFFKAIVQGREGEAAALLLESYLSGASLVGILDETVAGAMQRIGRLWHGGELSLIDEHLATRTTMRALEVLSRSVRNEPSNRREAFCCATEEEYHEVALLCVQILLESEGWQVKNFGANTPFFALTEIVARECPQLVCISSTTHAALERTAREYAQLHEAARACRARIVLGGEGFRHETIRQRFPADLHAENFRDLLAFVRTADAPNDDAHDAAGAHAI